MTQATTQQALAQLTASNTPFASPQAAVPASNGTVVDVADNSTTVRDGAAILLGVYVNTVLSNHALPIKDGTATVLSIPAQAAAGTFYPFPGIRFGTSLVVDPDDTATGNITVCWLPQ
jgi:hypothetical protein